MSTKPKPIKPERGDEPAAADNREGAPASSRRRPSTSKPRSTADFIREALDRR